MNKCEDMKIGAQLQCAQAQGQAQGHVYRQAQGEVCEGVCSHPERQKDK